MYSKYFKKNMTANEFLDKIVAGNYDYNITSTMDDDFLQIFNKGTTQEKIRTEIILNPEKHPEIYLWRLD
jgi:hypothetical protein